MEKGTNYAFLIKEMQDLTFQKVNTLSGQFVRDLPQDLRETLLGELKCGPQLIETEPSMAAWFYACGDRFEARLQRAFSCLPSAFFDREIEWIDYDCGLAAGTMVYHDFMTNRNLKQVVRRITLIHPSDACLKRAALHVHRFFPQTAIRMIRKPVNLLEAEDLATSGEYAKLHLLANIRNMDTASAIHLAELIKNHLQGYNQFICVSPYYGESSETVARLDTFAGILAANADACFAENLKAGQFLADKSWTCSLRIFALGGTDEETACLVPEVSPESVEPDDIITSCDMAGEPEEMTTETCGITEYAEEDTEASHEPENGEATVSETQEKDADPPVVHEPEREEFDPVRQLRALAEQGNAKAQNNLGFLYELGQDIPQSDAEAVKWYRKAAEQGNAKAQYNLANHYAQGRGIAQSSAQAVIWYQKAAGQGILNAMNHLAAMYASGDGIARNDAEALKWYRTAAARGDEYARRILRARGIYPDETEPTNVGGEYV
ncbi:MAG: sel1 repeat family protein [Tannerella sp.]|jgi:hypothetical protein|nr:sel1 repeat family protein [Tannerella sp.]